MLMFNSLFPNLFYGLKGFDYLHPEVHTKFKYVRLYQLSDLEGDQVDFEMTTCGLENFIGPWYAVR